MNPFYEFLKKASQGFFFLFQRRIAEQHAAYSLRENLEVVGEATKDAEKIIDLGNVLTAGNDPAKQRLGAMIKDYATEGMNQVLSGQLPKEVMAIEADHPFSENSERSGASLPGTPRASAHFLVDGKELTESGRNPRKALISGVSTRRRSGRAANTGLPEQSPNRREDPRIGPCSYRGSPEVL